MNNPEWEKQAPVNQARLKRRKIIRKLRRWQMKAVRRYVAANQKEFLITATPGSGKSAVAAEIALQMLKAGKIKRIVVVVPSEQLKFQWARVFAGVGIDLDPNWSNGTNREADDYHGVIVTYQQVSAEPFIYDLNCEGATLVIFDEIHHAADALDWGLKLKIAFARAAFVLSLSGTPFRHDNNSIPFVRYDSTGRSIADFSYTYGDALGDGVCPPVFFPAFEGSASWYAADRKMKTQSEFSGLSKENAAELLRAVLDPDGDWMQTVFREADEKLSEFRAAGHTDAGGLIIAIDQQHAKRIAKRIKGITGEEPSIVISEDPEAARILQEFARPGCLTRWIVAVKMISEGIDLPRLRVAIFATNILSELFFRQAVGRLVRIVGGLDDQSAAFYLPAHPILIKHGSLPSISNTPNESPNESKELPAKNRRLSSRRIPKPRASFRNSLARDV
jgi:superfamily II DNA or RNA helicase